MLKLIRNLILFLIVLGLLGLVYYYYQLAIPVSDKAQKVNFVIETGEGVNQISQNLYEAGFIRSMFWFETYAWQKKIENRFVAGTHEISPAMNIMEIVSELTDGAVSRQDKITIIEGWNNKQIAVYLAEKELVNEVEFLEMISRDLSQFTGQYDFLADKPETADLEGYLFPDTYHLLKTATPEDIVHKMLENFDRKLTSQMREDIQLQDKSIFEVLIMASILEKEVRSPEDMKIVADIFYKRLEAGIALQSDATVAYVSGSKNPQATAEDLAIDSPYNTYKYRGLPPTPIANPGLNAIMAAIYPTLNDYYYFLTTLDTGEVIYSRTYEEHLQNKAKYLD